MGLGAAASACTMANHSRQSNDKVQAITDEKRDFIQSGDASLQERAKAKNLIYGAATDHKIISSDSGFADSFAKECAMLVPATALKWYTLRPSATRFDFAEGDALFSFARTHNMLLRGHTLVWDQALPEWFKVTVNRQNAEAFMSEHITAVVKHYAGQVHSWDVVNEAINAEHDRSDGLQKTPWLQLLGPGYIDTAFRIAAQADPKAMLVYNDRWLDYDTERDTRQRSAVLRLLEHLKSIGTPVHALGIQAHLRGNETRFAPRKLRKFLSDIASLDLKILITELDVRDNGLPFDIAVRDRIVAGVYEDYLSVVLEEPAVIAVVTWGLSDRSTWLSTWSPRTDKAPVRPLPLDAQLKRKLAWNAIARAFDKAPKR
ncbi:MAG: endo-1,4-beta-xylanase [Microcoleus sp. SIO2G3]|nr:endo-1,4-beta-xylanase [Microcoleus sp. SIO2G3]